MTTNTMKRYDNRMTPRCAMCDEKMERRTWWQRYCTAKCRNRAWQKRNPRLRKFEVFPIDEHPDKIRKSGSFASSGFSDLPGHAATLPGKGSPSGAKPSLKKKKK